MVKPWFLPVGLLVLSAALAQWLFSSASPARAFAGAAGAAHVPEVPSWSPLDLLHYKVILASHTSYPIALMIGFCCYGNVMLRKACNDKPYPNWLFGYPVGFICYTYAGAIASDIMFVPGVLRAKSNHNIFICYTFWFLAIQSSERVYRFLCGKHAFIFLTVWWLADASRASLCFLERSVSPPHAPVFSRGLWQCYIWCTAGPIFRLVDRCIRGEPVPKMEELQPNTLNVFKFPLIAMFWNMVFYMTYLMYFTDCNLFCKENAKTMHQCGLEHPELYAACTYIPCLLHFARAYYNLYIGDGNFVFGETFCLGACTRTY